MKREGSEGLQRGEKSRRGAHLDHEEEEEEVNERRVSRKKGGAGGGRGW